MPISDWMYDPKYKRWTYTPAEGSVQESPSKPPMFAASAERGFYLGMFNEEREALWQVEEYYRKRRVAAEIQALEQAGGA
jgi:hypothetical protein